MTAAASFSVSVTVPLKISIEAGPPVFAGGGWSSAAPAPAAAEVTRESWFGRARSKEDILDEAITRFDVDQLAAEKFAWRNALTASLCSYAVYQSTAAMQASTRKIQQKFETWEEFGTSNTEGAVASTRDAIVVSFRGTQQAGDWWINFKLITTDTGRYGSVHRGFYDAFHSVRPELDRLLTAAGVAHKPIILTGHSLGGAIATIAAAVWYSQHDVRTIYTFGQPAVGFTFLRSYLAVRYGERFSRFVNEGDMVAQVPPFYRHVGKLFHFQSRNRLSHERTTAQDIPPNDTPMLTVAEFEQHRAAMAAGVEPKPQELSAPVPQNLTREAWYPNTSDHALDQYIERLLGKL